MDVISAPQTINAAGDGREAVEHEWLAAGQRGDVAALTRLRQSHPRWLALDRVCDGIGPVAAAHRSDRDVTMTSGETCDML